MSFVGGPVIPGTASSSRFATTRGRMANSTNGVVGYPSPFFDIASTYIPPTVKSLFKWCRYYFLTNPLINATCFKLSEYPVTDLIVEHENPRVKERWTEYLQDHLRYRAFQVETGLDYHTYGNCLISPTYPFIKYLRCQNCSFEERAKHLRQHWSFTNYGFRLTCPRCHDVGEAVARDVSIRDASGIKLLRWNPEDVDITYNDITGQYTHFYTVPVPIRNDVVAGKKDIVEALPQIYFQALREQKGIVMAENNLFHMKRPGLASVDRGWGTPLLLPVLKDTFYLQLMKKAQEAVLLEHIVPLRVLFPQAGSGTSDAYTTINLTDWRDHVAAEIARWRYDNNYIPIMPLPIGNQTIGGDGKALLLTQEIQAWSEQIMVGMGVPREFLLGGMSYAGTNVSMRMLENAFIGYLIRQQNLVTFVMKNIAAWMGWPEVRIRFKPFKMADDLQRKSYNFQLNAASKISDTTLLADSDFDQEHENELMIREADMRLAAAKKQQVALAEVQGEAQLVMMKYQATAQLTMQAAAAGPAAPGEPGGPESGAPPAAGRMQQGGLPPGADQAMGSQLNAGQDMQVQGSGVAATDMAGMLAKQVAAMASNLQPLAVANIRGSYGPEVADLVVQMLASMGVSLPQQGGALGQSGQAAGPQVDMRPLPEQRAPRRQAALV